MAEKEMSQAEKEQAELDNEDAGTGGKARDGEPNGDGTVSLDERRRGKTPNSQLKTDGSEEPQTEDPDGQQAWDVDPSGKRMTTGSLIPKSCPVEYKTKVDGKSVVLRGGLNDPSVEQIAVSALYTSKIEVAYTRDDRGEIVKCIVTETKTPRSINPAKSEAGQMMLGVMPSDAAAG